MRPAVSRRNIWPLKYVPTRRNEWKFYGLSTIKRRRTFETKKKLWNASRWDELFSGVFLLPNTPCHQKIRVPERWKNYADFWLHGLLCTPVCSLGVSGYLYTRVSSLGVPRYLPINPSMFSAGTRLPMYPSMFSGGIRVGTYPSMLSVSTPVPTRECSPGVPGYLPENASSIPVPHRVWPNQPGLVPGLPRVYLVRPR